MKSITHEFLKGVRERRLTGLTALLRSIDSPVVTVETSRANGSIDQQLKNPMCVSGDADSQTTADDEPSTTGGEYFPVQLAELK